ncbi:MAG: DUF1192 domain-containing protein [Devosia sp.]
MDDEPAPKKGYALGDDLSRMSVDELKELRQDLLAEADRIAAEIEAKDATRSAAANFFKS